MLPDLQEWAQKFLGQNLQVGRSGIRILQGILHTALPSQKGIFIVTSLISKMYSGNAERLRLDNLVSLKLQELVVDVICSLHSIGTRSHRIRTVVKFYNHTSRLRYGCRPTSYLPFQGCSTPGQ